MLYFSQIDKERSDKHRASFEFKWREIKVKEEI